MKHKLLFFINIIIIFGILLFVIIYSRLDYKKVYNNQVANFEDMTVAMESITENYLEGEQRICDVWATYINSQHMTLEEAKNYIADSHVLQNTMAHLIYVDGLTGLSTKPSILDPSKYTVSYANMEVLDKTDWISDVGKGINISREYANPMNGVQSLAFINKIKTYDSVTDEEKAALLLRVVYVSELQDKWVFPQKEFQKAELSLINSNGDYIIRGNSYKNNNFYEFYRTYNEIDNSGFEAFKNDMSASTGSFTMNDSKNNSCIIAHTPLVSSNGWLMLNYIRTSEISRKTIDWLLVGVSTIALFVLLLLNSIYMRVTNKRLHQMAIAAESANKAKTAFLSTMSHDIRTPMNAIIGLTTIAEKMIDNKEMLQDKLHKISIASNHLLTLINDILDISKIESGKLTLNPIIFSITESSKNLVNMLQPMIKEKNLYFEFNIENIDKDYLYADKTRLNQIYINILSNAVKYTPENGKVLVYLRQEESTKEGCVKQIFVVSDNGMGMTPEFMKTMYDSFSRQVDSRVNKIQGTGLGLAITKKMVDLMGGTIECTSEQGVGTTFTITIDLEIDKIRYDNKNRLN